MGVEADIADARKKGELGAHRIGSPGGNAQPASCGGFGFQPVVFGQQIGADAGEHCSGIKKGLALDGYHVRQGIPCLWEVQPGKGGLHPGQGAAGKGVLPEAGEKTQVLDIMCGFKACMQGTAAGNAQAKRSGSGQEIGRASCRERV